MDCQPEAQWGQNHRTQSDCKAIGWTDTAITTLKIYELHCLCDYGGAVIHVRIGC